MDDLLGEYLLQGWIPGTNLLRAWMGVPDTSTREWWVAQLAEALRSLHEVRCDAPGEFRDGRLDAAPSWRVYVESRVRKRLDALMRVPRVDRELILAAERYLRRRAGVLDDRPCSLIHRDCHFSNVVVDGPHLAAILDFELAEAGPPDYELDTLFRMVRYPALYGPPEFAGQLTPARFASVWLRLRRGYPELFAGGRLRERLCLYALDHDLSCLLQAATHPRGTAAEFEAALARLREILSDRYGPD
jgi:aminoglycoside phosphotransferase (APT) family kinase protein